MVLENETNSVVGYTLGDIVRRPNYNANNIFPSVYRQNQQLLRAHVISVAVDKECRQKGLASELMRELQNRMFSEEDVEDIYLYCRVNKLFYNSFYSIKQQFYE